MVDDTEVHGVRGVQAAGGAELADAQAERRRRDVISELQAEADSAAPDRDAEVGADPEVEREYGFEAEFVHGDDELPPCVLDDEPILAAAGRGRTFDER